MKSKEIIKGVVEQNHFKRCKKGKKARRIGGKIVLELGHDYLAKTGNSRKRSGTLPVRFRRHALKEGVAKKKGRGKQTFSYLGGESVGLKRRSVKKKKSRP